jgi:hypothetical protein
MSLSGHVRGKISHNRKLLVVFTLGLIFLLTAKIQYSYAYFPVKRIASVGSGPTGIAYDPDNQKMSWTIQ